MEKLKAKKELGKTGIYLPPIIFGTSALGNLYKALDWDTKLEIIKNWFEWVESPVVIDTAGKYGAGLALEEIGKGLKALDIHPDDIIISNKLGWFRTTLKTSEPTFEPGVWMDLKHDAELKIGFEGIMACYEQGLGLLRGNYQTEILSVHDPDEYLSHATSEAERNSRMDDILEGYRALDELKKHGKARAIGVGAKDWKIIRAITDKIELDWVMLATSFTIMEQPVELLKFMDKLKERGIAIFNSAVFHSGFLTGSLFYNYQKLDPDSKLHQPLFHWRESFYGICRKYDVKPSDAALLYGLNHSGIIAIALNTSRPEAIRRNVALLDMEIPQKFWNELFSMGLIQVSYGFN
jgi:D-threo-aldose 1-dehydrogenase